MDSFSRFFIVSVLILDLVAIVYFGGQFLATGHILPHEDHNSQKLAQLVKIEEKTDSVSLAQKKPEKKPLMPASADRGERVSGLCLSCHSFKKDGRIMTGPPIWDIVGSEIASYDGYQYSQIFMELKEKGVTWTEENLDAYLKSPRSFAPGTKMSFAGIRKEQQRIDLIAYLKTLK